MSDSSTGRWIKRILAVLAVAGVALLLWSVWEHLALMDKIERARPLQFFAVMTVLPALGVPITPFFILAGASFGVRLGLIGSGLALAANLAGCYWLARRLRPFFESLLRRFGFELPDLANRSPARFAVAVKVAPGVPAFVKNYALGLAGVPFGLYFGLSMLMTGVYAALLVVLGESLLEHNRGRAFWAVVAVVALALILWLRRRRR